MSERKPSGVSFETWVDTQIREARARGEFDNLPGTGKPIPDIDGQHDEMWWLRQMLQRENLSFTPPALALRKAAEDLLSSLAKLPTERAVRNVVDELNTRIRELNRTPPIEGPPSTLMPLDTEQVVARWSAERPVIEAATSTADLHTEDAPSPRRRLFRRQRP